MPATSKGSLSAEMSSHLEQMLKEMARRTKGNWKALDAREWPTKVTVTEICLTIRQKHPDAGRVVYSEGTRLSAQSLTVERVHPSGSASSHDHDRYKDASDRLGERRWTLRR